MQKVTLDLDPWVFDNSKERNRWQENQNPLKTKCYQRKYLKSESDSRVSKKTWRLWYQFNLERQQERMFAPLTTMTSSYSINFNHLPNELKTLIFSFLEKPTRGDISYLGNAALVCRQWRQLAENPDFWDEVGLIITLKGRSRRNCFFFRINEFN